MITVEQLQQINENIALARALDAPATEYENFLINTVGLERDAANEIITLLDSHEGITNLEVRMDEESYSILGKDSLQNELASKSIPYADEVIEQANISIENEIEAVPAPSIEELIESIPNEVEPEFIESKENAAANEKAVDLESEVIEEVEFTELEEGIESETNDIDAAVNNGSDEEKISIGFEGVELEDSINTQLVIEKMLQEGVRFTTPFKNGGAGSQMTYLASDYFNGVVKSLAGDEIKIGPDMAIAMANDRVYVTNRNPEHNYQATYTGLDVGAEALESVSEDKLDFGPDVSPPKKVEELSEEERASLDRKKAKAGPTTNFVNLSFGGLAKKFNPTPFGRDKSDLKALKGSGKLLGAAILKDLDTANTLLDGLVATPGSKMSNKKLEELYASLDRLSESFKIIKESNIKKENIPKFDNIKSMTDKLSEKLSSTEGKKIFFGGLKAVDTKMFKSIKDGVSSLLSVVAAKVSGTEHAPG